MFNVYHMWQDGKDKIAEFTTLEEANKFAHQEFDKFLNSPAVFTPQIRVEEH